VTLLQPDDRDWVGFAEGPIPATEALAWANQPECGAISSFSGVVREFSEGRPPIIAVEYDAYREHLATRLEQVATAARKRWPEIGRLVLIHRLGKLAVGEASVFIAVSTPHRRESFDAARFIIDTVKTTAPIWKREFWVGGSDWAHTEHELLDVGELLDTDGA
jgi:molybdopterin synthase catalytic subunit